MIKTNNIQVVSNTREYIASIEFKGMLLPYRVVVSDDAVISVKKQHLVDLNIQENELIRKYFVKIFE